MHEKRKNSFQLCMQWRRACLLYTSQAANVAEAAGENVTKTEFKALLDALKEAGIMAGG